jgi:hypothetical protein
MLGTAFLILLKLPHIDILQNPFGLFTRLSVRDERAHPFHETGFLLAQDRFAPALERVPGPDVE